MAVENVVIQRSIEENALKNQFEAVEAALEKLSVIFWKTRALKGIGSESLPRMPVYLPDIYL